MKGLNSLVDLERINSFKNSCISSVNNEHLISPNFGHISKAFYNVPDMITN